MSQNKRIFVEKRGIFDVESPKIFDEVKAVIPSIQSVKVYNVYDIFGLNDGEFEKVVNSTFVDPVTDILIEENPAQGIYFALEFLPGQYDQRADSAQQCIARARKLDEGL
jgi:phosphoribosylformylglycinamidine synthase